MKMGCTKQFGAYERMAPGWAIKVLLATRPRALLRSTLTTHPSAKIAPLRNCLRSYGLIGRYKNSSGHSQVDSPCRTQ